MENTEDLTREQLLADRAKMDPGGSILTDEVIDRIGVDIETELASADWPRGSVLAEVENFKRYARRLRPYVERLSMQPRLTVPQVMSIVGPLCIGDATAATILERLTQKAKP